MSKFPKGRALATEGGPEASLIKFTFYDKHIETKSYSVTYNMFQIRIQGVKKRMDPLGIFTCFITVSFQFLEIYIYEQVKPNKTKLFGVP